jgi:hypothetical protein
MRASQKPTSTSTAGHHQHSRRAHRYIEVRDHPRDIVQNAWIEIAFMIAEKSGQPWCTRLFCALLQFRYVFLKQTRSRGHRPHALTTCDTADLVILSPACAQIRVT